MKSLAKYKPTKQSLGKETSDLQHYWRSYAFRDNPLDFASQFEESRTTKWEIQSYRSHETSAQNFIIS